MLDILNVVILPISKPKSRNASGQFAWRPFRRGIAWPTATSP
jgi:hypothetical protein